MLKNCCPDVSSGNQGYQGYPALQGTVIQVDPTQAIFPPLVLNLKLVWGIISVKDASFSQAPLTCKGHVPTAPKLVS